MKKILPFYLALVALTLDAVLAQCQQLTIQPETGKQMVFSRGDIESLPHVKVTTHASETSATFEGVGLKSHAVAAMKEEGVYDKVKDKFVLGENISQAASFVISGSADVGIVALSLALSPNMKDQGRYAEIPPTEYPSIDQACVILSSSKNKETARQFLSFIKTAAVANTLKWYGLDVSSISKP
jgi:molybdenum ABC transporter molybdate-binding protein